MKEGTTADRHTKFILTVIAACLLLLVVKVYDMNFVARAEAASDEVKPTPIALYGYYSAARFGSSKWEPVEIGLGGNLQVECNGLPTRVCN